MSSLNYRKSTTSKKSIIGLTRIYIAPLVMGLTIASSINSIYATTILTPYQRYISQQLQEDNQAIFTQLFDYLLLHRINKSNHGFNNLLYKMAGTSTPPLIQQTISNFAVDELINRIIIQAKQKIYAQDLIDQLKINQEIYESNILVTFAQLNEYVDQNTLLAIGRKFQQLAHSFALQQPLIDFPLFKNQDKLQQLLNQEINDQQDVINIYQQLQSLSFQQFSSLDESTPNIYNLLDKYCHSNLFTITESLFCDAQVISQLFSFSSDLYLLALETRIIDNTSKFSVAVLLVEHDNFTPSPSHSISPYFEDSQLQNLDLNLDKKLVAQQLQLKQLGDNYRHLLLQINEKQQQLIKFNQLYNRLLMRLYAYQINLITQDN